MLAKRQAELRPPGDAAFQISGIVPAAAKGGRHLLAYLVAVNAVDDNRSIPRQVRPPFRYALRSAAQRRNQRPIIGFKTGLAADVDDDRGGSGADQGIE